MNLFIVGWNIFDMFLLTAEFITIVLFTIKWKFEMLKNTLVYKFAFQFQWLHFSNTALSYLSLVIGGVFTVEQMESNGLHKMKESWDALWHMKESFKWLHSNISRHIYITWLCWKSPIFSCSFYTDKWNS